MYCVCTECLISLRFVWSVLRRIIGTNAPSTKKKHGTISIYCSYRSFTGNTLNNWLLLPSMGRHISVHPIPEKRANRTKKKQIKRKQHENRWIFQITKKQNRTQINHTNTKHWWLILSNAQQEFQPGPGAQTKYTYTHTHRHTRARACIALADTTYSRNAYNQTAAYVRDRQRMGIQYKYTYEWYAYAGYHSIATTAHRQSSHSYRWHRKQRLVYSTVNIETQCLCMSMCVRARSRFTIVVRLVRLVDSSQSYIDIQHINSLTTRGCLGLLFWWYASNVYGFSLLFSASVCISIHCIHFNSPSIQHTAHTYSSVAAHSPRKYIFDWNQCCVYGSMGVYGGTAACVCVRAWTCDWLRVCAVLCCTLHIRKGAAAIFLEQYHTFFLCCQHTSCDQDEIQRRRLWGCWALLASWLSLAKYWILYGTTPKKIPRKQK